MKSMYKATKKILLIIIAILLVACSSKSIITEVPSSNKTTVNEESLKAEFTKLPEKYELSIKDGEKELLAMVEAKDSFGVILPIEIDGDITFGKEGEYLVKLIVKDSNNKELLVQEITVIIKDNTSSEKEDSKDLEDKQDTTKKIPAETTGGTGYVAPHWPKTVDSTPIYEATSSQSTTTPIQTSKPSTSKDRTAPVITAEDIVVDFAHKAHFDNITAVDETDGAVLVTFVGEYNHRKAGVYPMTAIARDKAGNTSKVSFNVVVNPHARQGELDEAELAVAEAAQKLADTQKDLSDAKTTLANLESELEDKKAEKADKVVDLLAKKEALRGLENALEIAKEKLADAQDAYNEALEFATSSPEFKVAKEDLDAKSEALEVALQNEVQATTDLENAKLDHEVALLTKDIAIKNVETKQAAKTQTEQAVTDAAAELAVAEKNAHNSLADKQAAETALATAQTNYDTAVQNRKDAEKTLNEAKEAGTNTNQRLIDAQVALLEAEAKVAETQAVIDQGSYGYFAYHNNDGAMAVIDMVLAYQDGPNTTMTEGMRTNLGKDGDATSLANMERAIRMIPEGNQLRHDDPLYTGNQPDLLVTDTMMALGQVRANASSDYYGHWQYPKQQGYNIGENLAWGYADPYVGWYWEEKEVYDWFVSKGYNPKNMTSDQKEECVKALKLPSSDWVQVGHYLNILTNYKYTGFGINGGKYGTMTQEFSSNEKQKGTIDTAYTVDEYLEDFLTYKNKVEGDLENAKALRDEVQALFDKLMESNGLSDEEREAIEQATIALENAKNVEEEENQKVADAKETLTTKENALNDAQDIVKAKEDAYNTALGNDNNAQDELDNAIAESSKADKVIEDAEEVVTKAELKLKDAKETVETAKEVLQQAEEVINTMNNAIAETHKIVTEAQEVVAQAETNKTIGENSVAKAEIELQQATNETTNAEEVVEAQIGSVNGAQQTVEVAEQAHSNAVEVRNEIKNDIENTPEVE